MPFFKRKYKTAGDEQLMEWLAGGDESAFSHLYDRYASRLYAFFHQKLYSDSHLAEDYVQEIFCKVFDHANRFKKGGSFRTWVFAMAYNLCKNEYRKRSRQAETRELSEEHALTFPSDDWFDGPVRKQILEAAIKQLKEEHRECLYLRYQQGLSLEEISEILEIPKGTVKSRLYYAIKQLSKVNGER